jgi:uncharacterized metal-binding protein YceD (DUF177 family)
MSKDHFSERVWSVPVAVAEIPETGRRIDMAADAHMREAIAKVAGVLAVSRFEAEFDLTRHGRDGVRVVGSVSATIEQQCVLTLEPMESKVEEAIDLIFAAQHKPPLDADSVKERATAGEPPEMLRDGIVDLGAVAVEFLILGIDPYPRKPGAVLSVPQAKEKVADHPFAALAALKKGKSGRDR